MKDADLSIAVTTTLQLYFYPIEDGYCVRIYNNNILLYDEDAATKDIAEEKARIWIGNTYEENK